jgi:hypothetical protein
MGVDRALAALERTFDRIIERETLVTTPHLRDYNGQVQNSNRQALTAAGTGRHLRRQRERHAERYLHRTVAMVRSVKRGRDSTSQLLGRASLD